MPKNRFIKTGSPIDKALSKIKRTYTWLIWARDIPIGILGLTARIDINIISTSHFIILLMMTILAGISLVDDATNREQIKIAQEAKNKKDCVHALSIITYGYIGSILSVINATVSFIILYGPVYHLVTHLASTSIQTMHDLICRFWTSSTTFGTTNTVIIILIFMAFLVSNLIVAKSSKNAFSKIFKKGN